MKWLRKKKINKTRAKPLFCLEKNGVAKNIEIKRSNSAAFWFFIFMLILLRGLR